MIKYMEQKKKIVTIGGGSGQYVLLTGLRDIGDFDISAVVSMVDSGGSTGRLRDEYGVLPPGDILKCIVALSPHRDMARKILQARFSEKHKRLQGHNAGNMLLTILSQYADSFPAGIEALGEILEIKGTVLPVTTRKATLVAILTDGTHLYGEAAIDVPRGNQREKIRKAFLVPHHDEDVHAHPPALEAIRDADYIIIGPGDLFTSIIPNFLVPGVKEAIADSKAKTIYINNIMTKFGETDGFTVYDFLAHIESYIDRAIDFVLVNNQLPEEAILVKYKEQKASPVLCEPEVVLERRNIIKCDLLESSGSVLRHDAEKLAQAILGLT